MLHWLQHAHWLNFYSSIVTRTVTHCSMLHWLSSSYSSIVTRTDTHCSMLHWLSSSFSIVTRTHTLQHASLAELLLQYSNKDTHTAACFTG